MFRSWRQRRFRSAPVPLVVVLAKRKTSALIRKSNGPFIARNSSAEKGWAEHFDEGLHEKHLARTFHGNAYAYPFCRRTTDEEIDCGTFRVFGCRFDAHRLVIHCRSRMGPSPLRPPSSRRDLLEDQSQYRSAFPYLLIAIGARRADLSARHAKAF